jgi:aspartyl/glutamyl-tRNA(Asn/Gln) amidotransferase C subunit
MEKDLSSVLRAFRVLEKAPTARAAATFQPIEVKNVTRKDEPQESLMQEEALANTLHKRKGFFLGPRVV